MTIRQYINYFKSVRNVMENKTTEDTHERDNKRYVHYQKYKHLIQIVPSRYIPHNEDDYITMVDNNILTVLRRVREPNYFYTDYYFELPKDMLLSISSITKECFDYRIQNALYNLYGTNVKITEETYDKIVEKIHNHNTQYITFDEEDDEV